jgi:hypothetical protein
MKVAILVVACPESCQRSDGQKNDTTSYRHWGRMQNIAQVATCQRRNPQLNEYRIVSTVTSNEKRYNFSLEAASQRATAFEIPHRPSITSQTVFFACHGF